MGLSLTNRGLVDRAGRVVLADLGLVGPVPADLVVLGPVVLGLVGRAVRAHIRGLVAQADRVVLDPVDLDLVALVVQVVQVDQGMSRVVPADRLDPVGAVVRAAPAVWVDRHRRRTRRGVRMTGVALRWAAPGTYLTDSVHPATARLLRPRNTVGVGTAGLHPERRRLWEGPPPPGRLERSVASRWLEQPMERPRA